MCLHRIDTIRIASYPTSSLLVGFYQGTQPSSKDSLSKHHRVSKMAHVSAFLVALVFAGVNCSLAFVVPASYHGSRVSSSSSFRESTATTASAARKGLSHALQPLVETAENALPDSQTMSEVGCRIAARYALRVMRDLWDFVIFTQNVLRLLLLLQYLYSNILQQHRTWRLINTL